MERLDRRWVSVTPAIHNPLVSIPPPSSKLRLPMGGRSTEPTESLCLIGSIRLRTRILPLAVRMAPNLEFIGLPVYTVLSRGAVQRVSSVWTALGISCARKACPLTRVPKLPAPDGAGPRDRLDWVWLDASAAGHE